MKESVMGARLHPGREPSDPAPVEEDPETKSQASVVASFRGVRLPAVVLCCLITTLGGFGTAWLAKPAGPTVALSDADRAALQSCATVKADMANLQQELRSFRNWAEPQIGLILIRIGQPSYAPPPPSTPVAH